MLGVGNDHTPLTFTENWYHPNNVEFLAGVCAATATLEGRIVEVGCWEGRSTVGLANAAFPEVVHAVDTWAGSPGEISETLAAERDVYATFLANMATLTAGNVQAHRMDWRDYFADRSPVKFIHIDATHSYDEVRENVEAVKPLMVPGGIVCGDDAHDEQVLRAARDALGTVTVNANLWMWCSGL